MGPEKQDADYEALVRAAYDKVCGSAGSSRAVQELRWQLGRTLVSAPVEALPRDGALQAVDELLQCELNAKDLIEWETLPRQPLDNRLALWQGDITTLRIGAIVNAANEQGLGCFQPDHRCIDNVIHRAAGPRLRASCARELQRRSEVWRGRLPTGEAMVTPGFGLPADFVVHTPGPVGEDPKALAACYRNVLELCRGQRIRTVAFCCISTGLFGYPSDRAAEVAVRTVRDWLNAAEAPEAAGAACGDAGDSAPLEAGGGPGAAVPPPPKPPPPLDLVVFNTFLDKDFQIYKRLLEL